MRLVSLFVALMLSGALVAACGDDDDEALSKSEYIRLGDAICAEWAGDFNKLFEEGFPTTQSALTKFFGEAAPLFERRMSRLRALEPPEGGEDQVNGFLAAGDKAVSEFRKASNDPELAKRIFAAEGGKNEEAFTKQAQAYGLSKCEEEDEDEGEEESAKLDPSTFPADKRAFVERLDARCRESDKQTDALEERYLKRFPPPISGWAEFLPRLVKILRADTEFARGVTPPAADKAKIEELLDEQEAFVDKLDEAGKAAQEGDEKTVNRLTQEVFSESDNFDAELRKYGFQVCGEDDEAEDEEE